MADQKMGLLLAGLDRSAAAADEFDDWYDTEHIPERLRIPGFLTGERWIGVDDPALSVSLYDLESAAVLRQAAFRAVSGENLSPWSKRMTGKCRPLFRFEAEQILPGDRPGPAGAGGLMMFAMNPVPEADKDFNDWYNEEHVPSLARVPGCLCARRFRILDARSDGNQRYLAVYHLESPGVCSSEPWKRAIETPWTHRIRPRTRDRLRHVLRPARRA
jgi:hypothetical protein